MSVVFDIKIQHQCYYVHWKIDLMDDTVVNIYFGYHIALRL